ncbi:MAG TPA: hypothetical protein VJ476_02510, partial [Rhizomicrobium sp.]|nr:hypothetical protein [Rhizomicrobium sp.]
PTLNTAKADGAKVAGAYVVSRRGETNFTRYLNVFQPIIVSVDSAGIVTVPILVDAAGQPKHWREVKPFVWQEVNGKSLVQAKLVDGKVSQIGTDDIGPIVVLMPAPLSLAPWNFYLLVATLAIFVLTVLLWPIKAVLRWRYDRPLALIGRARTLYRLTRVVALVDLAALTGFPLAFLVLTSHLASLPPSIDWLFRGLQLLTLIGVIGTVVPVWEFATAIGDRARPWWTKATDLLIVLAALATVWFAFSQHLLTLGLKY